MAGELIGLQVRRRRVVRGAEAIFELGRARRGEYNRRSAWAAHSRGATEEYP